MSSAATGTDSATFRRACAEFATGVTAITARTPDGEIAAMCANSFTSVSLEPPIVLFCVGKNVSSAPLLAAASHAAVHVLDASQEEVARRLATSGLSGAERLEGVDWAPGRFGEPVLSACAGRFSGPIIERIESGDHLIYLLGVEDVSLPPRQEPALLFHRGRFSATPTAEPEPEESDHP